MGPDENNVEGQENLELDDTSPEETGATPEGDSPESEEISPESSDAGSSEGDVKEQAESNKKLKRRVYHVGQENEALRRENQELKRAQRAKEEDLVEPNRDDFESIDEYISARDSYVEKKTRRDARAEIENEQKVETQQEESRRLETNWAMMTDEAREKYEDFDYVLGSSDTPITYDMSRFLFESEYGAEIAYHMSKDNEVAKLAKGIEKLSSTQQVAKLVRIEDMVKQKLDKPSKNTSDAPKPTKPVKPGGTDDSGPNDKDSTEDWMKKRQKQKYG